MSSSRLDWYGRFDTPLTNQNIINGSVQNTLGIPGAKIIVPRNLARSILHVRASSLESTIKMPPDFGTADLVATGSDWKHLDNGSNQGTAWKESNFDDCGWASGPAQLGFGDGDKATVVNGGLSGGRFITTYFRHQFVVTNATSFTNLVVSVPRDDGAVIHLNGVEIFRGNMPEGAITSTTTASGTAFGPDESVTFYFDNLIRRRRHWVTPTRCGKIISL